MEAHATPLRPLLVLRSMRKLSRDSISADYSVLNCKVNMSKTKVGVLVWLPIVGLAWLVPGAGHFLLKRPARAALLFGCVLIAFIAGLMMRGALFSPQTGDLFTTLIYCGGFAGNLASGAFYLLTVLLGYSQPDVAGHVHDYGTKLLVGAGLLNVLAMVDAYEIAVGKKE